VFTNVARIQTQQSVFIFNYGKCSVKQAIDNDDCMANEDTV